MESIVNKLETLIRRKRKGKIYFAENFATLGNPDAVRKSLMRLEKSGFLIRVARGIYLYPEIDEKLGLGVLIPSADTIAKAIARRDKARIVPTGSYALNALGLSSQVVTNVVYLTDGSPRKIQLPKQRILFKHTSPKNLAYRSDVLMLVVSALKEIGSSNVTEDDLMKIKSALSYDTKENILADLNLAPMWIRKIILSMRVLSTN